MNFLDRDYLIKECPVELRDDSFGAFELDLVGELDNGDSIYFFNSEESLFFMRGFVLADSTVWAEGVVRDETHLKNIFELLKSKEHRAESWRVVSDEGKLYNSCDEEV